MTDQDWPVCGTCGTCGAEMEEEDCWRCGGDGEVDMSDHDPLWYYPGEMVRCEQCDGKGGYWLCPTCKEE